MTRRPPARFIRDLDELSDEVGGDAELSAFLGVAPRSLQRWRAGGAGLAWARTLVPRLAAMLRGEEDVLLPVLREQIEAQARADLLAAGWGPPAARNPGADRNPGGAVCAEMGSHAVSSLEKAKRPGATVTSTERPPRRPQVERTAAPAGEPSSVERSVQPQAGEAAPGAVRILRHDGVVETVSPLRAARMLRAGTAAEPDPGWSRADAAAILEADREREARQAKTLEDDGLIVGAGPAPSMPMPDLKEERWRGLR